MQEHPLMGREMTPHVRTAGHTGGVGDSAAGSLREAYMCSSLPDFVRCWEGGAPYCGLTVAPLDPPTAPYCGLAASLAALREADTSSYIQRRAVARKERDGVSSIGRSMRDRGERRVKGRSPCIPVERVKAHLFDGAGHVRRRDLFVVVGVSNLFSYLRYVFCGILKVLKILSVYIGIERILELF